MSFPIWLQKLQSALAPRRGQRQPRRPRSLRAATHRLDLEPLEDRRLLAFLAPVDYTTGAGPFAIVSADFNDDDVPDLATANMGSNTVSVLLGNVGGTFQPAVDYFTGATPVSLAVGDLDGDGKIDDLATANYDSDDVSVLLGNDDGTFQEARNLSIGSHPASVAVGDFNGDGLLDLGVTSTIEYPADYPYEPAFEGNANVLLGTGTGSFLGPNVTLIQWDRYGQAIAADVNGDGFDDFVALNSPPFNLLSHVAVMLGNSNGYLQSASFFNTSNYLSNSMAAGDMDADGDIDLVTVNYAGDDVSVLQGDGSGGFTLGGYYATLDAPTSVVLGDFTGDGTIDVVTGNYYSANLSVHYGVGDGSLSPVVYLAVGSRPYRTAAGDFNSDGWLDAATSSGGTSVAVLINDQSWPSPPPPSIGITDVTVTEGNTGTANAGFTLTLSRASSADVTVHYATADITAASGSDYTAAFGDVTIPAGQTSATFTIAIKGDRTGEPTETFAVNLTSATSATIADSQAIGTIIDNEPRVSISDVTKAEGKNGKTKFTFVVTLSAAYDQAVTMSFATANGIAKTSDNDYVAKTGTLTFAPGETVKTITIEIKGDSKKEANETFYLDLFGLSSNALFTKNRGLGTILNDD